VEKGTDHGSSRYRSCKLVFVAVDFEPTSLTDVLRDSGFDFESRTFCSWLGVTHYLSEEVINVTFEFVHLLPRGSEIVFEFKVAAEALSSREEEQDAAWAPSTEEPILSRFMPADLEAKLRRIGFSQVIALTPEDAQEHYFEGRRDASRPRLGCTVL
jgi:methyltransferase (TIGR00027 family)